jgi:membrane associated rhomboid family serine protease
MSCIRTCEAPASQLSYSRAVRNFLLQGLGRYEAWRVFTSSFTHLQLPHLLLNAFGLWATRRCEWKLGSVSYLATTAVFMFASQVRTLFVFCLREDAFAHSFVSQCKQSVGDAPCKHYANPM